MRGKYDAKLQKYVTTALTEAGLTEDRGACKEMPGTFKFQHDTNKNLLFMHVFAEGVAGSAGNIYTIYMQTYKILQ